MKDRHMAGLLVAMMALGPMGESGQWRRLRPPSAPTGAQRARARRRKAKRRAARRSRRVNHMKRR